MKRQVDAALQMIQETMASGAYQQMYAAYGVRPVIGAGGSIRPGRQSHGGTYGSPSGFAGGQFGIEYNPETGGYHRRGGGDTYVQVSMYEFREEQIAQLIERAAANNRMQIELKSQNLTGEAAFNPV